MITETRRPESQLESGPWRWASGAGRMAGLLVSLSLIALVALILVAAALPLFGYRTTVIYGGSMAPAIGQGALVISRMVDPATLTVDDIITFRRPEAKARVTHRIVAIRDVNGQQSFTVKGDANSSPDPNEITFEGQVEKLTLQVPYIGYVMGFARSPRGMLLLVVLPAFGLAILQVLSMSKGKAEARGGGVA